MVQARITIGHMAPTMVQTFLNTPGVAEADLSALRTILYSGAPMPLPLLRRGLALLGPIFRQSYGQTEGSATALLPSEHDISGDPVGLRRLSSVGRPLAGVELRIAGEDDEALPTGTPGEVLLRTPSAMVGYWNNSVATIETLRGGWLHTGDIGKVDEDGFLTLVDRKKDVIISGGENIYSREVEDALGSHPDVAAVAVIGVPDPYWGETVCAVVVPTPAATPTLDSLEAHSRTRIASYKRLRRLEIVADLPYLATGKVDKKALRARYVPVK
jgi:acyl-CoA synthetase (AMP-forming)/AMP-acid ligase II